MRSIVLCEGSDDLWFISYYLHKTAQWTMTKANWTSYKVPMLNRAQKVNYMENGPDSVAIWSVGGKDAFAQAVEVILDKFVAEYPQDPIHSVVLVRDRDNDDIEESLEEIKGWVTQTEGYRNIAPQCSRPMVLANHTPWVSHFEWEGYDLSLQIVPVVIPFCEKGAIESLLLQSIRESGAAGNAIVEAANEYINGLIDNPTVTAQYLNRDRLILKARFSAVVAATSPDHSTGRFQDLVMACPWEQSESIQTHFTPIAQAVSLPATPSAPMAAL